MNKKKNNKTAAVILASGTSQRFNDVVPKQYKKVENKTILEITLKNLLRSNIISSLYVVYNKKLPWTILKKKKFGMSFDFDKKNNLNFLIKSLEKIKKNIRLKNHKVKIDNFLNKNYNWDLISKKYDLFYKYDK